MTHSKNKGKRGELQVAALIKEHGFHAERGQQYAGHPDAPDVKHNLPFPIHIEAKFQERLQLYKWMDQAVRDAGPGEVPTVWHRKNRRNWLVTIDARDFLALMAVLREASGGSEFNGS